MNKVALENSDGRRNPEKFNTEGMCLYVAYSSDDEPLYVGETSTSIKRRFITDGSGAHKHQTWYDQCDYIKYCKFENDEIDTPKRKLLEQAFSIILSPKYYG